MPINCQFGQRATGLCSICGKWDIDVDRTEEGTWGRKGDGTSCPFAIGVGLVFSDVRAAPCVPFVACLNWCVNYSHFCAYVKTFAKENHWKVWNSLDRCCMGSLAENVIIRNSCWKKHSGVKVMQKHVACTISRPIFVECYSSSNLRQESYTVLKKKHAELNCW